MAHGFDQRAWVTALRGFPTFANCTAESLTALVKAGGEFHLPAGWPLVQEGIPADAVYVLTEGQARVFHDRQQIATVGIGDIVGEMALLAGGQRKATVTSSERVAGLRVENERMRVLIAEHPCLGDAFRAVYDAHRAADADR
jgi:CRP/FNR family cyclic AMP-dependent transcriptional regulator